ncbi:MAG: YitT family protein [Clostridiales bacterium]|nr:YitT family protein [Clostridiales bacterium]
MKKHLKHYAQLFLGSALYSLGYAFFIYPNGLIIGGITGVSTILNFAFGVPVGIMMMIINIPVFILGFRKLGLKFMLDSLASMVLLSVFIDVFLLFAVPITQNQLLASVFGGAVCGLGLGMTFLTGATTGGTDIIARVYRLKYQHINMGQAIGAIDAVILMAYAVIFKTFDKAMYSVISVYISVRVIDEVLYGINYGNLAYIISSEYDTIGKRITERLQRGVTRLYGEGAYTGEKKVVLMCAIKKRQIVELKKLIREADENAFVIISETREVVGLGFERIEV